MILTEENFLLFAAKYYDNPCCADMDEFYDDLSRFKYIKRLFTKYKDGQEIKERLILNHLIVLYNLFGSETTRMLFLKLRGQWNYLTPFLSKINRLPLLVMDVGEFPEIITSEIPMDVNIVAILEKI